MPRHRRPDPADLPEVLPARKRRPRWPWYVGGGAILTTGAVIGAQLLFGVFGRWPARNRTAFEASVVGATPESVRLRLGNPDEASPALFKMVPNDPSEGGWKYEGVTYNPRTGRRDRAAWLWLANGRVSHVTYDPP